MSKHRKKQNNKSFIDLETAICIIAAVIFVLMSINFVSSYISGIKARQKLQAEIDENTPETMTFMRNATNHTANDDSDNNDSSENNTDYLAENGVDISQFENNDDYAGQLFDKYEKDPDLITKILSNYENAYIETDGSKQRYGDIDSNAIPENLIKLAANNSETWEFVSDYPSEHTLSHDTDISNEMSENTVPELIQWDERWGYLNYGDSIIALAGCGPTCLSMVASYMTGNKMYTPDVVAEYADENGYYLENTGTYWSLMSDGCEYFGIYSYEVINDEQSIKDALDTGSPIICSVGEGDFTDSGHFIVIVSYDDEGFMVNDPNSIENGNKKWSFETLSPQIKAMWRYTT